MPSIEQHEQNAHHDGAVYLVQAIVNSFPEVLACDRGRARSVALGWRSLPGRLGNRLCLHAMRDPDAFSADEAMHALLDLNSNDFWRINREVAVLVCDRASNASVRLLKRLEKRIFDEATVHYNQYELLDEKSDWRPHARDKIVWLLLSMLQIAERLSSRGLRELEAIKKRREYLQRKPEDRDFFGSYSSGVYSVVGDSSSLIEAEPNDRLKIAEELQQSQDFDQRLGWPAFCRADPQGAFDTLRQANQGEINAALWNDFLETLVYQPVNADPIRSGLIVSALCILDGAKKELVEHVAENVANLLVLGPRDQIINLWGWWDRVWDVLTIDLPVARDDEKSHYDAAMNSSVGRLTKVALEEFDCNIKANQSTEDSLDRLRKVASAPGRAGTLARSVLVRSLAYLFTAAPEFVINIINDTSRPKMLREWRCGPP